MPSIKDESTVRAIALEFTSNGRCKERALDTIGYKKSYWSSGLALKVIYGNKRVIDAIKAIDEQKREKIEHNFVIAAKMLKDEMIALKSGNLQEKQLYLGYLRELNDIAGLHKQLSVNLNADIPSDPAQYKLWLQQELAKLDESKKVIESYEKSTDALAKRH